MHRKRAKTCQNGRKMGRHAFCTCICERKVVPSTSSPHEWGSLRKYSRVLRKIFKGECFSPSLTASELNAHIGHFYASINAPYAHLIHKIAFYKAKNTRKFAYLQFLLYLCTRLCKMVQ